MPVNVMLTTILMTLLSTEPMPAQQSAPRVSGYESVNGLEMYYESHGTANGKHPPLVLLHGGGSTIDTTFGKILPALAKTRQVIAFEQQGHGRTADIVDRPFTFEQSADDAAALLKLLKIEQADFFGFSNGGHIAMQVAIRHPKVVRKLVVASAGFKREGHYPQFWEFMKQAKLENMPTELRDAYLKIAPHPEHLPMFFDKCAKRMLEFKDWRPEVIQSIKAPTLVMVGDADVIRPEHALEMSRLLAHSRLAVLPSDHGTYLGEVTAANKDSKLPQMVVSMVLEFLDAAMQPAIDRISDSTK